ncbi:MAG TPA: hypothetical protein VEX18_06715, partial [Polyangiaceae bacterium]|nr:hypothetical protein [Polyangiaceae bacterium]
YAVARLALLLGVSLFAVAVGCGDDPPAASGKVCDVGETRECLGPGACEGAQECLADRTGFKTCDCGSGNQGGASPNAGMGGSESSPDAGGTPGTSTGGMPAVSEGGTAGAGETPVGGAGGAAFDPACHPVGNVGCEANQNCDFKADVAECVAVGDKQNLEICGSLSQCAAGLTCHFNVCVEPCAETADCSDGALKCAWLQDLGTGFGPVGGCMTNCDVLTQGCAQEQACYLGACMTATTTDREGEDCEFPNDCGEGLDCLTNIDEDDFNECTQYCSVSAQDPCPEGQTCYALVETFPSAPIDWGVCVLE